MTCTFNIAKGKIANYTALAQAGGGPVIKAIPLEATGLEAESTLKDYANVSVLLAGTTNEQVANMTRKVLASVTVTVDNVGDVANLDSADITWTAATGNAVGAILLAYDPTGSSADTALIPLTKHDWALTPDGSDATATVSNFCVCS